MFGSHLSIAGGLVGALHEATGLGLDTVQVFTKNQRQWSVAPLDPGAALEWVSELARLKWQGRAVAHDSYLINLASPDDSPGGLWEKSLATMRIEITRCAALAIPFLVSHPGAHMIKEGPLDGAARVEAGLVRIARAYAKLLRETRDVPVTICLENTAGGGTTLGRSFEELARLRELILQEAGHNADLNGVTGGRIGFCLDTCHALAAGYDISGKDEAGRARSLAEGRQRGRAMLEEFDRVCGLANLRVLHLNDSQGVLGSHIDRHEHIGLGCVALGAFAAVVSHPALARAPKIMETPKEESPGGEPMDALNLRLLRALQAGDEPVVEAPPKKEAKSPKPAGTKAAPRPAVKQTAGKKVAKKAAKKATKKATVRKPAKPRASRARKPGSAS